MTKNNAYKLLGLTPSCTPEEINKAYKKLAMKHHPDKGGLEANFKLVLEAKEVLLNQQPATVVSQPKQNAGSTSSAQYEEYLRAYLRQHQKDLAEMERKMLKRQRIMNFRLKIVITYFVVLLLSSIVFTHTAYLYFVCTFALGLIFVSAPTWLEIKDIFVKHYHIGKNSK